MLQYKTVYMPGTTTKIKKSEWDAGFSSALLDSSVTPFGQKISDEAKGGWTLHSVVALPVNVTRKKTIIEMIFGWIPLLGSWICPRLNECYLGKSMEVISLVFVKEVA